MGFMAEKSKNLPDGRENRDAEPGGLSAGRGSIQEPGGGTGLGDLAHLVQQAGANRDSLLHAPCGVVPLRIARHHDRLRRVDGLCRPQVIAKAGHVGGEFVAVAEEARIDRDQTMPDTKATDWP